MRRRILLCVFGVVSVLVLGLGLIGCVSDDIRNNPRLSELRENIFVGQSGDYRVVAVTGMREDPFKIDGVSQAEKVNFTVITVTPTLFKPFARYDFRLSIGGREFTGRLQPHPFNQTLSAEISVRAEESQLTVHIIRTDALAPNPAQAGITPSDAVNTDENGGANGSGNGNTPPAAGTAVVLNSVIGENFIDANKAFGIAYDRLKSVIDARHANSDYEIFVRLIENPVDASGGFRWYVAFVFTDGMTYAALIDPVSMDILAVKEE